MIYIDDQIEQFDIDGALAMVSEQRRQHAMRYRREHDRRLSLAAYRLLQQALVGEYGIVEPPVFAYDAHGKPSLARHPGIFFSISHCREAVACAVSSMPVGIDVECLDRYEEQLVGVTMNAAEQELIANSPAKAEAFITLWTQKESLYKMTGEDLAGGIPCMLSDSPSLRDGVCRFRSKVYKRFVATVCHHADDAAIGGFRLRRMEL